MFSMQRQLLPLFLLLAVTSVGFAQQDPKSDKGPGSNPPPPRSDRDKEAGESSSRDRLVDISPPKDDLKNHPYSQSAVAEAEETAAGKSAEKEADKSDVQEFHPWDPHRAAKDIEVGDFYFKKKNYKAALDRYQEALYYKDHDAVATFRVAQCQDKLDQPEKAATNYEAYLKLLPEGEFAAEARKALTRISPQPNADAGVKK
jgi:tetratricopeptide (TPR) repeat protein